MDPYGIYNNEGSFKIQISVPLKIAGLMCCMFLTLHLLPLSCQMQVSVDFNDNAALKK